MTSHNKAQSCFRDHDPKAANERVAAEELVHSSNESVVAGEIKVRGRTVGEVRPDGVFQKHIAGSKHILRKFHAICLDVSTVIDALYRGAHSAEVHDDENGNVYHTSLAHILAKGIRIAYAGEQLALPIYLWLTGPVTEPEPRQLNLFGGEL